MSVVGHVAVETSGTSGPPKDRFRQGEGRRGPCSYTSNEKNRGPVHRWSPPCRAADERAFSFGFPSPPALE